MGTKLRPASIEIDEHAEQQAAKRSIGVDPFGGLITEGNLSIRIDKVDDNTTYIGIAQIGSATSAPVWQIKKISVSGTVTSILWADGDDEFNNVWDNRTSLTYS